MKDWTKRLALSALCAFLTLFVALPVSCCGFVLYNQHVYGDVQTGGPAALLKAMGVSALLACGVLILVWQRSRPR